MRYLTLLAVACFAFQGVPSYAAEPRAVVAAINDPGRPDADKARDAARHPAEMVAFAQVKPGGHVVDLLPGGGYFTRIFSKVVGPKGHVYAVVPDEIVAFASKYPEGTAKISADPAYTNTSVIRQAIANFALPEKVDVIFISQNYHDFHDKFFGPADVAHVNKAIFDALKPGGVYIVLDHAAEAGSGIRDTDTLHRIDPATVKAEVTAAGFVFDGESNLVRNPADPLTAKVFDPSIRGKTDQFVYRFRKPTSAK